MSPRIATNSSDAPTPIPAAAPALSLELAVEEGPGEDVPAVACVPAPVTGAVAPSSYISATESFTAGRMAYSLEEAESLLILDTRSTRSLSDLT